MMAVQGFCKTSWLLDLKEFLNIVDYLHGKETVNSFIVAFDTFTVTLSSITPNVTH